MAQLTEGVRTVKLKAVKSGGSNAAFGAGLTKALARIRDKYETMSILQIMVFAQVAANPGIPQAKLREALAASADSVVSRAIALLGARGLDNSGNGLGLVTVEQNAADTREKLVWLTPKGEKLLADMSDDLSV